ncbi:MAG: helix-turn-helix domain-containing protein [Candidatus Acidiferrales bacterium]
MPAGLSQSHLQPKGPIRTESRSDTLVAVRIRNRKQLFWRTENRLSLLHVPTSRRGRADGKKVTTAAFSTLRPAGTLAATLPQDQPQKMLPKVSQEMLAEMIGTTRSRVNFFMNKFRKLGFIHYNGGLQVHDSLLSLVLHE